MKKLSVILSVLLCLSAMVTGVSAKSTGEVLTGGDAIAIYEKCMNKMGKVQYLEYRAFLDKIDLDSYPHRNVKSVVDYKYAETPEDGFLMEIEMWDSTGEKYGHSFMRGGYLYDCMSRIKYSVPEDFTMRSMVFALTGTGENRREYGYDFKSVKAEKTAGGYRMTYQFYDYPNNKFTLTMDDDFMLESIIDTYQYDPYRKSTVRYEVIAVNRGLKIKFPTDLSSFMLV